MVSYTLLGASFIINLIVGTIILHIAAKYAKVEGATIMKALTVAVIAAIIALILGIVTLWGSIIAWIIAIVLIKYFYATTWSKAIFTWIIYVVISIVIGFILGLLGLAVFFAAT